MLTRKLAILDHPNPEQFNINDEIEFRSTVLWLEDQKIRHYKIEDRGPLRDIGEPGWPDAFRTYLERLRCPLIDATPLERLTWLASLAIRFEYSDNAPEHNAKSEEMLKKKTSAPSIVSSNPLDNFDFSSDAFASGIGRVATLACIGPHYDPRVRLGALASVLKTAPHPPPKGPIMEKADSPEDVLNLLFVSELRSLQTSINETLVSIQKVTANPKTDTALGKVGF